VASIPRRHKGRCARIDLEVAVSTPTPRKKPLLCRLKRHKWVRRTAEDGGGYFQCTACGKDATEVDFEHHEDDFLSGGGPPWG
jgi:hypothetical protein